VAACQIEQLGRLRRHRQGEQHRVEREGALRCVLHGGSLPNQSAARELDLQPQREARRRVRSFDDQGMLHQLVSQFSDVQSAQRE
jgi:hypothetical protein